MRRCCTTHYDQARRARGAACCSTTRVSQPLAVFSGSAPGEPLGGRARAGSRPHRTFPFRSLRGRGPWARGLSSGIGHCLPAQPTRVHWPPRRESALRKVLGPLVSPRHPKVYPAPLPLQGHCAGRAPTPISSSCICSSALPAPSPSSQHQPPTAPTLPWVPAPAVPPRSSFSPELLPRLTEKHPRGLIS